MIKTNVTKLWQGKYVSLRDYIVKQAINNGGIEIKHNNKTMQLKPEELQDLKPNSKMFQSKFKGSYKLIDILFKPVTEDPKQGRLIL
jgi:hypothetical protein